MPSNEAVALAMLNFGYSDRGICDDPDRFLRIRSPGAYIDLIGQEWTDLRGGQKHQIADLEAPIPDTSWVDSTEKGRRLVSGGCGFWFPVVAPPKHMGELGNYHLYVFGSESQALEAISQAYRIDAPKSIADIVGQVNSGMLRPN